MKNYAVISLFSLLCFSSNSFGVLITSQLHQHIPTLTYLAAKNIAIETALVPENLHEHVDKVHRRFYDMPDAAYYVINKKPLAKNFTEGIEKASHSDHFETMKVLINHGSSFSSTTYGLQKVQALIEDSPADAFKAVARRDLSPNNALAKAACLNQPKTVRTLLESFSFADESKLRAFRCALENNSIMCLETFIAIGVDVNTRLHTEWGDLAPLTIAAQHYDAEKTVAFLIANGADIHFGNDKALFTAVKHKNSAIVKVLVEHQADVRTREIDLLRLALADITSGFTYRESAEILVSLIAADAHIDELAQAEQRQLQSIIANPNQMDDHAYGYD